MARTVIRLGALVSVAACLAALAAAPAAAQSTFTQRQQQTTTEGVSQRHLYCRELEQQLAMDWQAASQGQEQLPQIEAEMRKVDRVYQVSQAKAEQADCYDYFFFSKTLRNTPQCIKIQRQIENARQRLAELEQQRQAASNSYDQKTRQDALIAELARNGCGPQYQQEAQRRAGQSFAFWDNGESIDPGLSPYQSQVLPYATYRTICVRLCDGYFFPISFATLPTAFEKDQAMCQSQCAAPAELFVYQNPGAQLETAMSLAGQPITELKNAWRYRKELIGGCSCNVAEYDPEGGKAAKASQQQGAVQGADPDATSSTTSADWGSKVEEAEGAVPTFDDDQIQALLDKSQGAAEEADPEQGQEQ